MQAYLDHYLAPYLTPYLALYLPPIFILSDKGRICRPDLALEVTL